MSGGEQQDKLPSEAELDGMSRDELVTLGTKLDGVEMLSYEDPWPVKGTKAEKRAERAVAYWFLLAAVSGIAFIVAFIAWPWEYTAPNTDGYFLYSLYTPVIGITLGLTVVGLGLGALNYTKKFILAELADAGTRSTITRRSLVKRTAGAAAGVMGLGLVVLPLGGMLKNPFKDTNSKDSLWHTGWQPNFPGEKVYLRRNTGDANEISLIKPSDLDAGGFETVFPFRESERGNPEALSAALHRADNPVMLIRLRPTQPVVKRAGQEDYNFGDYYAYSKICTHLGCPTSLFEQQTGRLLCPCHQSQFDVFEYAKPVFGPAARALPQLPITVDESGYFVALHDFKEPIGPAFWERDS